MAIISIQRAYEIMNTIAQEFGIADRAPPPLFVTEHIPTKYAGVFETDSTTAIKIRPAYFIERTVSHEVGHWIFHMRCPGVCDGEHPMCEEVAADIEKWWIAGQPSEMKHAKKRCQALIITTSQPLTRNQLYQLADSMRDDPRLDMVESVGLSGDKLVLKLTDTIDATQVDGIVIPIAWIIASLLGLLGIGVVTWKISEILGTIKEWGPYIIAIIVGLGVLIFGAWVLVKTLAPPTPTR